MPEQWRQSTIGEVAESMKNGIYKPAEAYSDDGIACLRMYNVENGKIVWKDIKRMILTGDEFETYRLLPGDILVNRVNSRELVGKAAVIAGSLEPCVFESKNIRLRLLNDVADSKFVSFKLLLDGSRHFNRNAQQVVGMASISQPQLSAFPIPLPPLAEQQRIVSKIEELFSELDAGEESLRRARRQLGVYRQSLLKQAFEGKLTAPWRAQHPDLLESPDQLLARIQAERQQRYQQQLKEWEEGDNPVPKPKKAKPFAKSDTSTLEPLPHGWAWTALGNLCDLENGDRGKNYPNRSEYVAEGIPWINAGHIEADGTLAMEKMYYITPEKFESLRSGKVQEGDLVYCLRGTLGKAASVGSLTTGAVASSLVLVRPIAACRGSYLLHYFLSPLGRKEIKRFDNGSAQPNLSANNVRNYDFPLCSLPEQQEIVRLLDEQFEVIEQNEREIDAALKRSEALRQSILKKAFTGHLVPQDPTDEPAAVLLERIRTEREVAEKTPKKKAARKRASRHG